MPKTPAKILLVDGATPLQLTAIQALVTQHANGWWHHMTNVWIVGSTESATFWRDLIRPIVATQIGETVVPSVLVLDLPPAEMTRDWAYFGPSQQNQIGWLLSNYQS